MMTGASERAQTILAVYPNPGIYLCMYFMLLQKHFLLCRGLLACVCNSEAIRCYECQDTTYGGPCGTNFSTTNNAVKHVKCDTEKHTTCLTQIRTESYGNHSGKTFVFCHGYI